jgi:ribonuclease Z
MFSPWTLGRQAPLDVYGPRGVRQMVEHLEEAWVEDVRVRLYGPEAGRRGTRAVVHEIEGGRIYDDGSVRVEAVPVPHATWPSAFGFRFVTPDRTIVVSGDTRPSDALAKACSGCDVLVHEVYSNAFFDRQGNRRYHLSAHTSPAEVAAIAEKAKPGLLVLYHQLLGPATDADVEREVRAAGYRGKVVSARDLDVF